MCKRLCTQYPKDQMTLKTVYGPHTSTPQLPFKEPQIPSNRDQKALNRGPLGVYVMSFMWTG